MAPPVKRSLVTNTTVIRKGIGENTILLRKLATVHKNGHYQKPDFIKKCKAAQRKRKWPITFDGDKIVSTDLNVSIILHLLNGDILTEPLYDEDFYVDGKHKLESSI